MQSMIAYKNIILKEINCRDSGDTCTTMWCTYCHWIVHSKYIYSESLNYTQAGVLILHSWHSLYIVLIHRFNQLWIMQWYSTVADYYWKNPHISGPIQFKPIVFKGQLMHAHTQIFFKFFLRNQDSCSLGLYKI